jgi:hypothetical protein
MGVATVNQENQENVRSYYTIGDDKNIIYFLVVFHR